MNAVKLAVNLSLVAFFLISSMLVAVYFDALYDKIAQPTFKHMGTDRFVWFGIAVTIAIFVDVLILKRFINRLKKQN